MRWHSISFIKIITQRYYDRIVGNVAYILLLLNAYKTSKRDNLPNAQSVMLLVMFTHAWFERYVLFTGVFFEYDILDDSGAEYRL